MEGKWPWQLAIQTETFGIFTYRCGAALINSEWAITSTSCVNTTGPFRLVAGEHTLQNPTGDEMYRVFTISDVRKVSTLYLMLIVACLHFSHCLSRLLVFQHPDNDANIALIHIDPLDLSSDFINTVCLPPTDYDFAGSPDCWITGTRTSNVEMNVNVIIIAL